MEIKHTFLNNQQVTEGIKKLLETNDNENTTTQNLWDAAKAVLRRKFIAMQSYFKKQENRQPNFTSKTTGKIREKKISRRKEIIKIRAEISEKEMKETIVAAAAKSLQSCPTLCNPIDGSPPGSPVPGILQARTLEWVAISFSNA